MKTKLHFIFYSLILFSLLLSACGTPTPAAPVATAAPVTAPTTAPATDTPTAAPAAPLTVLIDNDEGPITPANYNTFIGFWLVGWVYDPLYIRTPDLKVVPALATNAVPSADGLTWTITLRQGVKWHDGQPFTSADVIFTYNFLIAAGRDKALGAIKDMTANGDNGLTITLSAPQPFFLAESLAGNYIMPQHIWKDQKPDSGSLSQFQGMIGTGAYKLTHVEPGQFYTFEANPDYYRGKPLVEKITAKIVKDRTQQFDQLQTKEADAVLSSVPPDIVSFIKSNPDIKLAQGSDFFNYIFYMNGSRKPFDNPAVRQAISEAIDTKSLVDTVLLGQGVQLPQNWYHPDLPWSIKTPHVFDPKAAAAALQAAGLVDTNNDGIREMNGKNTDFGILCDVNNPVEVRTSELITGWLKDVGLGAHQQCLDIDSSVALIWPNFVAVPKPNYDMGIWGWSSTPQIQRGFIRIMTNCDFKGAGKYNLTGICDPTLDGYVNDFVTTIDQTKSDQLANQLQQRFAENLPWVPLMSPNGNFAYRAAAYDGWQYMLGTGIVTVWSFLPKGAQDNIP